MRWATQGARAVAAIAMAASLAVTPVCAQSGVGVLETSAGIYEFTPTTCAIYQEEDIDDIELGGPGKAPDGEEFYFELSSTANALTINLGASGPFASADRRIQAGRYVSQPFTVEVSGAAVTARDLVLVDENGGPVDDDASLTVDCDG